VIDAEKFANVVYHLVNNAQQATRDSGSIKIKIYADLTQRQQLVEITDDGDGMSDSFIQNRLFKPFDTTKGNAGMGIGAYDARSYLISIQGSLNVESTAGEGSTFTLSIPAN
jgi:signal transduction histidine kinase